MVFNGKNSKGWNFGKESVGMFGAELVSSVSSLGVVAVADDIAPNLLKSASKTIAKVCIEPYLKPIEATLSTVCKLEECQPDPTHSREERAEKLARTLIVFGAAWAVSMGLKFGTRWASNKIFKVDHPRAAKWHQSHMVKIGKWDEGVHFGSLILLNTLGAPLTDSMIKSVSSMLHKTVGWSEEKSHEVASMAVVWEFPNLLGLGAGLGAVAHHHFRK